MKESLPSSITTVESFAQYLWSISTPGYEQQKLIAEELRVKLSEEDQTNLFLQCVNEEVYFGQKLSDLEAVFAKQPFDQNTQREIKNARDHLEKLAIATRISQPIDDHSLRGMLFKISKEKSSTI